MKTIYMFIVMVMLCVSQGAAENLKKMRVSSYSVKGVTLPQAIRALNAVITKEHPGRKDLLVAYVASPYPIENQLDLPKPVEAAVARNITLKLSKNPPITTVVQYIVDKARCHWHVRGGQIIIYGWWQGVIEEPNVE